MSVFAGPEISQSGLIFAYDMGNTDKSWKGAPATNLITNPTNEVIATAHEFAIFADITPIFDTYGTGIYSISADIKSEVPGDITVYTASGAVEYNIGYYTAACESYYKRFYFNNINVTHTDPAVTYSNLSFYGTYGTGRKPSIKNVQIEKNAFCTPFVNGTRTNSQAILDLIGLNAVTATSLTYNSNNTFSFNGSSNLMVFPENSIFNTQTLSVEVWAKTNATTQNGFWFEKGTVNSQYALFQEGGQIVWRHTTNVASLTAPTATYMNTSQYAQVVGTYTAGDRRIYVNGIQVASDALNYSIPTNAGGCSIGAYGGFSGSRGYYFNGDIGLVRVYNRALTSSEISQNFNALRGRFGI